MDVAEFSRESDSVLPSMLHWILIACMTVFAAWCTASFQNGWIQFAWPVMIYAMARHQQETGEKPF